MKDFRLPRKIKKQLKGKLWLYPADEAGNRLTAFPGKRQEDYNSIKTGIVQDILRQGKTKAERKAERDLLDKAVTVPDNELRLFVEDIFAWRYRNSSYNTLIKAKSHPRAVIAYYNFVNAYHLHQKGEEYGNICCMSVDWAKMLLKR